MLERNIDVVTAGGRMPVFITAPEHDAPHATVILYMDGPGIREELRDMARRIGTVGYYVMLPNLFYRDGGPSFDPALLATRGPDPEMDRLNRALSHSMVLSDTRALIDFATADPAARTELAHRLQTIISDDYVNGFLFQLPKTGVADAKINGLWRNAPTQANDLTGVSWSD